MAKDMGLAQDHLEDYLLECAENVKSLAAVDAEIDAVLKSLNGGSILCPKNCSSNGQCTDGGCVCKPGFIGAACASSS